MPTFAENIFARLSTTAALVALVDDRIWPGRAEDSPIMPYVVWQEIDGQPDATFNEASTSGHRPVQFSCVAGTYAAAREIAKAIMVAIDSVPLAGGEVCLACSDFDGFSEPTDQFLRIVDTDFFAGPA